jgi:hypothetical protein
VIDNFARHPVEYDQARLAVLDLLAWWDEHARCELRQGHFPRPPQAADLAVPTPRRRRSPFARGSRGARRRVPSARSSSEDTAAPTAVARADFPE